MSEPLTDDELALIQHAVRLDHALMKDVYVLRRALAQRPDGNARQWRGARQAANAARRIVEVTRGMPVCMIPACGCDGVAHP